MKFEDITHGLLALLLAASLSGGSILAQDVEVFVRGGTITEFAPGERIVVRTAEVAEPVEYLWVEGTVIVGPDGQVLAREALREGISARIYYRDSEGRRVVDRVVVTDPEAVTTVATVTPRPSEEALAMLQERQERDRAADVEAALRIKTDIEAQRLIDSILDEANAAAIIAETKKRARIRAEETGRTEADREESVAFLRRRLQGEAEIDDAPESFRSRVAVEAPDSGTQVLNPQPRFYETDRRVVTYRTINEVPPVLIASSRLNRVTIQQIEEGPYAGNLVAVERRPEAYVSPEAYTVTYAVDPDSEVTRDDILFVQGSTAFADAYSHDLVVDLAMAVNDPELASESFVVEGHASAEGDYDTNLALSQARAERIVREMVAFGVSSSRLIPVGFGENEARYPADAPEHLRALDRRVTVLRLR